MGPFNIFGSLNIKLSDRFSKKVADAIGIYFLTWLILQILFWVILGIFDFFQEINFAGTVSWDQYSGSIPPSSAGILNLTPLLNGFTLFNYFPYWLRIIILIFVTIGIINIPISILAFFSISDTGAGVDTYSRERLTINCIECKNEIKPPGEWLDGEIDVRCRKCEALMTLTIENGRFKKLALKQATKYRYN
ncbi:MAG: hypothetical protein M1393_04775 [Candidatus Thermoplasmatota archaeon]|nr:hypothetical protein [Candidatus Thermoplasmatota archaeon]